MNPQFPIFIVSKGRWESRHTSKALEAMKVPYQIIVEKQEYKNYTAVIDKKKVLVLDERFKRTYDVFSDAGVGGTGSGPARNFAWEMAVANGHQFHWTVDDNIGWFGRLYSGRNYRSDDGTVFRCMEDFVLRYENIAMAGPHYRFFPASKKVPFYLNHRIYSCNLIRTDAPFRWRGRYNEDTDLSLRMLKAGWCTVLFNIFCQDKIQTLTMKGGNTDTIYKAGTLPKSQMLVDMHPDVCRLAWRFGRAHHFCDYKRFQHGLVKKAGISIPAQVDNYGMELVQIKPPLPSCGGRT